jgi:hypothetical protein
MSEHGICDCHDKIWGGIGDANGDPKVVGNTHPEVIGNDDTDVVVHKDKQLYPPLVIVPGELFPRLLSEVLAESRLAQIEQGVLDWPIDPQLLNMTAPILEAAVPQGASVHPGPNAVAPLVLNADAPQGGPANHPNQVVMSTPSQQGGPTTQGLQPHPQSAFNPQVALGGHPVLPQPVQQVQQQPAMQIIGAQRSANDVRFPTAEALQAGALRAPAGGATPDMMYRPFPGKHAGLHANKWYHGHPVDSNGMPHWQCAYCKCSTPDANAKRNI